LEELAQATVVPDEEDEAGAYSEAECAVEPNRPEDEQYPTELRGVSEQDDDRDMNGVAADAGDIEDADGNEDEDDEDEDDEDDEHDAEKDVVDVICELLD
jgi:hypothetical protein